MMEFYKDGEARNLSFFENAPMWPLVTYGIVNPYGPTLMGFGIIVHEEQDFTELTYYSLNPFQQEVKALGVFDTDTDPAETARRPRVFSAAAAKRARGSEGGEAGTGAGDLEIPPAH